MQITYLITCIFIQDFSNGKYRRLMTIEEAFAELENYVDASDPDLDLPNLLHLLQTAEG